MKRKEGEVNENAIFVRKHRARESINQVKEKVENYKRRKEMQWEEGK